mmetsp:Transcript_4261/g.10480  ORF Transcript_4261/g.10480 Transcript_4261/m.10480 type:complete len:100 (+) Transcript_4261:693-992(+)
MQFFLELSLLSNTFAHAGINDVVTAAILMAVSVLELRFKENLCLSLVRSLILTHAPVSSATPNLHSYLMDQFHELDKRANVDSAYSDFRCHLNEAETDF